MPSAEVSLSWHPHPDVWLLVVALAGGYLWAVSRLGPRRVPPDEEPASRRQVTLFMLGVAAIWVAAEWPVHDVAERSMYSVHMLQHMFLSLVAPPLLLMGTPAWLLRAILGRGLVLRVARTLCRPLLALVIFNGFLVVTHWPAVVDLSVRSEGIHFLLHAGVFLSALIMWSPVLNPLIELPHLSYPGRMFYLFLQSIVPTVPASFLTFASEPVYRVYETLPKLWGISALDDQRIAGLLMKLGGGFLLWTVIAVLFFQWFAREEAGGVDELEWGRVERELNRARLPRS